MNLKQLEKLMQLMQQYDMHKLTINDAESTIKLARNCGATSARPVSLSNGEGSELAALPAQPAHAAAATATTIPTDSASRSDATSSTSPRRPRQGKEIRSPFVGTYYAASSPGADPFIYPGKKVKKGEVLCIIEAMKLMNEIEAERDGTIIDILIANEEPVEYDQALFLFE